MTDATRVSSGEVDTIATTLAEALAADPGWIYLFGDERQRVPRMTSMLRTMIGGAYLGLGATWSCAGGGAAAVWMPPGQRDVSVGKQLALAPRMLWQTRGAVVRALRSRAVMEHHAPKEPHHYLAILGVAPAHQGRGLGAKVVAPVLDTCDATRTLAWLESTNPANHGFYRRLGFVVAHEETLRGGPTFTFFARQPR
jgi:GNAT superfamily N-acetyltransferase